MQYSLGTTALYKDTNFGKDALLTGKEDLGE